MLLLSTFIFVLSFGDVFNLVFSKNYKIVKATITDKSFIINDEKFKDYQFFKFEVSYEFTKNDNKIIKSKDLIISPAYYIVHKYKDTTYVIYNEKDDKRNHVFQIYFIHFIVSIALFYKAFMDVRHFIKYKIIDNI